MKADRLLRLIAILAVTARTFFASKVRPAARTAHGTTMDELLTSGRSVSIGLSGCGHSAAAKDSKPYQGDPATTAAKFSNRIGLNRVATGP
jgi:hypothetical protein